MTASRDRPIVLVGAGVIAQVTHEYLTHDSDRRVAAFAVDRPYVREPTLLGKPVVAFDELLARFPPSEFDLMVAVGASQGHRLKRDLYDRSKALGYQLASYVSSTAVVAPSARLGDNCFVTDHAVVQPFARIGNGAILWIGSLVAHHAVVGDFCMLAGHSILGGLSTLGDNGFLGISATVIDEIVVAPDCLVGAGSVVTRSTLPGQVVVGNPATPKPYTFHDYFKRQGA